jgi:muconate cycloisomerase
MKITTTDAWTVVVPTIPGRVHSQEYGPAEWDRRPKQIIRVNTDEGIYGLGETGRGCPLDTIKQLANQLKGKDPRRLCLQNIFVEVAPPLTQRNVREWEVGTTGWGGSGGYEAFEMALFDILGKFYGVPAHALLGGACRDRVAADYWIGHQTPEDSATNARRGKELGFKGLKMKCSSDEPMVERLQAIRDAVGPDFTITVDPNQHFYRPCEAVALAREFEKIGNVAVFEDPMAKWNLDWYCQLRAATTIPVALHLATPREVINAIKVEAVDYMNLAGTMVGFVKLAAIADAAGIPVWRGSGNDLGVMEMSFLHAASAARNCVLPSDLVGSWTREDDLIVDPLIFENGYALVPDKPGLGCELDMDAIEKYRVSSTT